MCLEPRNDWSLRIEVVYTKRLLSAVHVDSSLVFRDLVSDQIPLSAHGPNGEKDLFTIWDIMSRN